MHKAFTKRRQIKKFWSPPRPIIIVPKNPPDNICRAPVIPVAVPECFPAAETPPAMQLATVNPFPSPKIIRGSDI